MATIYRLLAIALLAFPIIAQDVNRSRVTVGVGAAASTQDMDPGIGLELNFGIRYTRYIQADFGLETSFNKDYRNYNAKFDSGLTTSTNFLVPVGGRIVIPIRNGRIEPSFGLGGVYRYDKNASVNQNQGGVYGLAGVSYALDSMQRHRVGVTTRYFNIMSAGRPHPQWTTVFGEYTYSWGE